MDTTKKPMVMDNRGLTLVEIIAVLFIIGVIGAIVVGRAFQDPIQLTARADNIKAHLRYAQARALSTSSVWGLRYDPSGKTYRLFQYEEGVEKTVRLPGEETDLIDLSRERITPIGFSIISFDTWGRPCRDIPGLVTGGATVSLHSEGKSITIAVTPETGFIP
ncbi:MAG: pilus assembly FimT family protein [Thermodesulfobacteriota bacterium]